MFASTCGVLRPSDIETTSHQVTATRLTGEDGPEEGTSVPSNVAERTVDRMTESGVTVDVGQVGEVIDFYARAAAVVGDSAVDIRHHDLGSWAMGEQYQELGARYREMGEAIAARLADHAAAADRLAAALHRGMTALVAADADSAGAVSHAMGNRPGANR